MSICSRLWRRGLQNLSTLCHVDSLGLARSRGTLSIVKIRPQWALGTIIWRSSSSKISGNEKKTGPPKVKNLRPRGIVPIGEDYGGYDESKHEEFEQQAEDRQKRIQWLKKIVSSTIFVSIFVGVMWARNRKQRQLNEYTKNVKFLPQDLLFTGSYNLFCIAQNEDKTESIILPASIVQDGTLKFIQSMNLRPGDVVVASFPKTGTTWVQEIVYLIENNLDFKKASGAVLEDRFPYLEYPYPGVKSLDKITTPRLIKTHLSYSFLPKNVEDAKIIYITRNPKDTAVSYYYFTRMLSFLGFVGSFDEFLEHFMNNKLPYCNFFRHIESFLAHKDDQNLMIITYEELSKDPHSVVQNIANFLGKPLSPDDISKVVEHTTFQAMSSNSSVNYRHWDDLGLHKKGEPPFMRKGKVGDWENYFNSQTNSKFENWIKENNKFNVKFDYHP